VGASTTETRSWTFLTHHARVMILLARDPGQRVQDLADIIGISIRALHLILDDLEGGGYLTRHKVGRRNTYTVVADRPLRHPIDADHDVADLLALFSR
jgi:DNA-binding MarR family transcriptional regulator